MFFGQYGAGLKAIKQSKASQMLRKHQYAHQMIAIVHCSIFINPDGPRFIFLLCPKAFKGWRKSSGIVIITNQIDHLLSVQKI